MTSVATTRGAAACAAAGLAVTLLACGSAPPPPPKAPPPPPVTDQPSRAPRATAAPARRLAAATTVTTPAGARLAVPQGWYLTTAKGFLLLEEPDRELKLWLVEAKGRDLKASIVAAWKALAPGFALPVKHTIKPPAREGWDEMLLLTYVTPSAEHRKAVAFARRVGDRLFIMLLDGNEAAFSRRGAQVSALIGGLKAPGVTKESFAGKTPHPLTGKRLEDLTAFIEKVRQAAKVPGAAVAIVQDGKVVLERGFGVRDLGKKKPVTPKTLFLIGSMTKPLTSLMMSKLVEEQRFAWDTKVTKLYPSFALGDPATSRQVAMKHTVCACTGLPRQDMEFLFEYAKATPEQRLKELASMKPTTGFGETFQYSNPLVSAGGYVAAHALFPKLTLSRAYDRAMKSRVFGPLQMRATTFDFRQARRRDHATPHGMTLDLTYVTLPVAQEQMLLAVKPAGGAWSNVQDMARYLQMELARGKSPTGKVLFAEEPLLARRAPQVKASADTSYGLALLVSKKYGLQLLGHGGGTFGFSSDMFFLPEVGVGMVILTNAAGGHVFTSTVARRVLEILFDGRPEAEGNLAFSLKQRQEATAKELALIDREPPAAWIAPLAGTYHHPALGRIVVRREGPRWMLDAGEWQSRVGRKRKRDGLMKLVLLDPPLAGLGLVPSEQKGQAVLTLSLAQQEYVFLRQKQ